MFRTNILVKNGRVLINRSGFYRNLRVEKSIKDSLEKFYIVKVKNDKYALTKSTQPLNKVLTDEFLKQGGHWQRLNMVLNEIFDIYMCRLSSRIKDLHVDEKITEFKKRHAQKLSSVLTQENINKIVVVTQDQLKALKHSNSYAKFQKLPETTKELAVKANFYWLTFNESQYKDKIIAWLKICLGNGKKGAAEIISFAKHVYNAPGNGKSFKH